MATVFGTLSFKGGTGKSTLATIIAGEYASYDKRVLLIDTDPSQNSAAWWRLSAEKENQPEFVDFASVLLRSRSLTKMFVATVLTHPRPDRKTVAGVALAMPWVFP